MSKLVLFAVAVALLFVAVMPVVAQSNDLWMPVVEGQVVVNTTNRHWLNFSFSLVEGVDTDITIDGVVHHITVDGGNAGIVSFPLPQGSKVTFTGIPAGFDRYQMSDKPENTMSLKYAIYMPLISR